jgi:phosphoglycolate phosphatase
MTGALRGEKYSLLMFDLDGTIADTIYSIKDAVNMALTKHSFPERSYDEVKMAIGNGARKLIERSLPESVRDDADTLEAVFCDYEYFYEETYTKLECYSGMYESMISLKEKGYTLAVLSNKQDAFVKKIIDVLFEVGTISMVLGQTDMPKKPDPFVPLMIAKELGIAPEECAFIGDSEVDVRTGLNAGMGSVGVSWGYRDRSALEAEGAHVIVDDPRELLEIFK